MLDGSSAAADCSVDEPVEGTGSYRPQLVLNCELLCTDRQVHCLLVILVEGTVDEADYDPDISHHGDPCRLVSRLV